MGVKKSTVCTRARCRSSRYTPASSKVFELTSTLRSNEMGSCGKDRKSTRLNSSHSQISYAVFCLNKSNILFGNLHKNTSEQLALGPVLMAAADSPGCVIGNLIDAQLVVVASPSTNQYGYDGKSLR